MNPVITGNGAQIEVTPESQNCELRPSSYGDLTPDLNISEMSTKSDQARSKGENSEENFNLIPLFEKDLSQSARIPFAQTVVNYDKVISLVLGQQ